MTGPVRRRIAGFGLAVSVGLVGSVALGALAVRSTGDNVALAPHAKLPPKPTTEVDAGPVAAMRMVDRLQLFQTGNAGTRIELDGSELTALLRHTIPGILPAGVSDPVVQIVEEASGETLYTLRIQGTKYRPQVFAQGSYTIKVGEPGTDRHKVLRGVKALDPSEEGVIDVDLD